MLLYSSLSNIADPGTSCFITVFLRFAHLKNGPFLILIAEGIISVPRILH